MLPITRGCILIEGAREGSWGACNTVDRTAAEAAERLAEVALSQLDAVRVDPGENDELGLRV